MSSLFQKIEADGRFTCGMRWVDTRSFRIDKVRLRESKPYCGQHPGPCENPFRTPRNGKWLEWDDWVAFHDLVNDYLDSLNVECEAWTNPLECRGKMWIRKLKLGRRVKWDYERTYTMMGVPRDMWNTGTDDQFQNAPA